jgi:uncharacterized membrane protein
MSNTELYLLGFALVGWGLALYYHRKTVKQNIAGLMLLRSVIGVALGKTKIEVVNGNIKLTDLEDNDHGNTSNQDRQGESTDRT